MRFGLVGLVVLAAAGPAAAAFAVCRPVDPGTGGIMKIGDPAGVPVFSDTQADADADGMVFFAPFAPQLVQTGGVIVICSPNAGRRHDEVLQAASVPAGDFAAFHSDTNLLVTDVFDHVAFDAASAGLAVGQTFAVVNGLVVGLPGVRFLNGDGLPADDDQRLEDLLDPAVRAGLPLYTGTIEVNSFYQVKAVPEPAGLGLLAAGLLGLRLRRAARPAVEPVEADERK